MLSDDQCDTFRRALGGASWKCADRSRGFHRASGTAGRGGCHSARARRTSGRGAVTGRAARIATTHRPGSGPSQRCAGGVEPPALIGCVAQAIVAGRRELEDEAAVAVWLASGLAAETFHLDFVRAGSGGLLAGYRFDRTAHDL